MNNTLTTPVALLIFNRPLTTKRVFDEIRKARPRQLFVVADGPRTEQEREQCTRAREVLNGVDWDCEVHTNYSEINLGCKKRVSSGIDWVFSHVERAIILEDDCLPHPTFFRFCEELLEKYKDNPNVMHISGDNFQAKNKNFLCAESYYFSNISHIWGWATWRRAWSHYDVNITQWPIVKKQKLLYRIFNDEATVARWEDKFQQYYEQNINSWDGQWSFACLIHHGLCIMPCVNLISNIGFGKDSTHTKEDASVNELANLPVYPMKFPLIHPSTLELNTDAVDYLSDYIFGVHRYRGFWKKVKRTIKRRWPASYQYIKRMYG